MPKDVKEPVVIDTTGKYNYPNKNADVPGGSVRGHFATSSVKKVLVSSPFKGVEKSMPDDARMIVSGINDSEYNSAKHKIISPASCTTTCTVHMFQPLLLKFGANNLKCFELYTIHAGTGKQTSMDRVPARNVIDPVHFQAMDNNIFVSSTGADKALRIVMPALTGIPGVAKSIRVPTQTSSLVILTTDWNMSQGQILTAEEINATLAITAKKQDFLEYVNNKSTGKNILASQAATTVQGADTEALFWNIGEDKYLQKVVLYGWYDNEFGYVRMLVELLKKIVAEL